MSVLSNMLPHLFGFNIAFLVVLNALILDIVHVVPRAAQKASHVKDLPDLAWAGFCRGHEGTDSADFADLVLLFVKICHTFKPLA